MRFGAVEDVEAMAVREEDNEWFDRVDSLAGREDGCAEGFFRGRETIDI